MGHNLFKKGMTAWGKETDFSVIHRNPFQKAFIPTREMFKIVY